MPLNGSKKIRYRFTIALLVIVAVIVYGFVRLEQTSRDIQKQVTVNTEQGERLEKVVKDLEAETHARTVENCLNQVAARETVRKAFLDILTSFPPSERLQAIIDTVNTSLKPLTCPEDSTVVIPQPQPQP